MHEICPHCGKESNEDAPRFCSGCGARMDGKTPAGYPGYSAPVREQKNRLISGVCSSVLPGLGQVYNGETAKGFAIFILTCVGLTLGLIFLGIPGLIVWLYGIYNAYTTAGKMNTGEIPFRETRMLSMVLFIVFAVAVIAVALLVLIYLVIDPLMSQFGTLDTGNVNQLVNQLLGSGGVL